MGNSNSATRLTPRFMKNLDKDNKQMVRNNQKGLLRHAVSMKRLTLDEAN
jgi:hypothetical protein